MQSLKGVEKFQQEKEKCLKRSIEERRSKKKCTELSSIETWPEYYNGHLKGGLEHAVAKYPEISNKVSIWRGDITSLLIDAIVNSASEKLVGVGGVDGAINSAAGPFLKEECSTFGEHSAGECVITGGYELSAKYVIHAVGPRGENADKLRQCYESSLDLLIENKERTIAFPCISTGKFDYPKENAAEVALETVQEWLKKNYKKVDRVIFCLFDENDISIYEETMQKYFPMESCPVAIKNTSSPAIGFQTAQQEGTPRITDGREQPGFLNQIGGAFQNFMQQIGQQQNNHPALPSSAQGGPTPALKY